MNYHIKTQYGCGKHNNGHMKPDPFLGSGQGAGNSMSRWSFISDASIKAYNKLAISAPITGPLSNSHVLEHIQAFVDDSHGPIIHDNYTPHTLLGTIQHNKQTWEKLLNTVGGKLEFLNVESSASNGTMTDLSVLN
jgi:hypothetical protein